MPSLAKIWREGFRRIGCGRRCREINSGIEHLQKERPKLLISLAKTAWETGAFGTDFSTSAADLLKTGHDLKTLKESLEASRKATEELDAEFARADGESSIRIRDAAQPFREAKGAYDRLNKQLEGLEYEKTRLEHALPLLHESSEKLEARIAEIETSSSTDGRLARLRSDLKRRRRDAIDSESRMKQIEEVELPAIRPEVESVARSTEALRSKLEELETEESTHTSGLKEKLDEARRRKNAQEREARALEDSILPLLFQLGEELNGRRVEHEALSEHYNNLDAQLEELKKLHTALGIAKADLNELDTAAVRFFWGLAIGAGALLMVVAIITVAFLTG